VDTAVGVAFEQVAAPLGPPADTVPAQLGVAEATVRLGEAFGDIRHGITDLGQLGVLHVFGLRGA